MTTLTVAEVAPRFSAGTQTHRWKQDPEAARAFVRRYREDHPDETVQIKFLIHPTPWMDLIAAWQREGLAVLDDRGHRIPDFIILEPELPRTELRHIIRIAADGHSETLRGPLRDLANKI